MKETRRKRLQELLDSPRFNGDRGKFCQDAGITSGRLSQLFDPEEPFGDVAARNLIEKLNLSAGYFDKPEKPNFVVTEKDATPEALRLAALFDLIPEDQVLRRAQAYSRAVDAIASVLQPSSPKP